MYRDVRFEFLKDNPFHGDIGHAKRKQLIEYMDNHVTDFTEKQVEALFRAAIYGNISLILGGVCSYRAARRAFELLHGSFCRLSEEGREFNGYIKYQRDS